MENEKFVQSINQSINQSKVAQKRSKNKAFSLAEVLITLGIIGVIAAMTIPTLVQKYQEQATVTELKKVYSELLQTTERVKSEEGDVAGWIPDSGATGDSELTNVYAKKMRVMKNCTENGVTGCWATKYKYLNGTDYPWITDANKPAFILSNGVSFLFGTFGKSGSTTYGNPNTDAAMVYAWIYVDINGPKAPNVIGQDVFSFFISGTTIVPYGSQDIKTNGGFDLPTCRMDKSGHGCAGWVLYKGNIDYLGCKTGAEEVCSAIH